MTSMADQLYPTDPILIIDDEVQILSATSIALKLAGLNNVVTCSDSREVESILQLNRHPVITLDLFMPHVSGADLLPLILELQPDASVIVVTGNNDLESAVSCMRNGAFDFLVKPVDRARLVTTIRHALESVQIREENERLKESLLSGALRNPEAFSEIITRDDGMKAVYKYVEAVATTPLPVLITGETGVGKELLAKAIHRSSGRPGEFVAVNVAGLDDALFSDTLFGHRKGAYTGATSDRAGMIGKASGGTLFLDEIGDLAVESQIKLLRLLQEKEYHSLGADVPLKTDARFVFATNKDLEDASARGEFRTDLYYRLRSHRVTIPPLRERRGDLPLLVDFLLTKAAKEIGRKKPTAPKELFEQLSVYDFPGNVRELEGMIYDAVVRHESGMLSLKHIRDAMEGERPVVVQAVDDPIEAPQSGDNMFASLEQLPELKSVTEMLIEEAMSRAKSNQTVAARILGMTRTALNKRLNRSS